MIKLLSSRSYGMVSSNTSRLVTSKALYSSSTTRPENEYLAVIPDFPGKQTQRAQARAKHIEGATPLIEAGQITYFGVILARHINPEEILTPNITGSAIVMKAESEKAVLNLLETDAYTKAGVWNMEKAQIWPFKSG